MAMLPEARGSVELDAFRHRRKLRSRDSKKGKRSQHLIRIIIQVLFDLALHSTISNFIFINYMTH